MKLPDQAAELAPFAMLAEPGSAYLSGATVAVPVSWHCEVKAPSRAVDQIILPPGNDPDLRQFGGCGPDACRRQTEPHRSRNRSIKKENSNGAHPRHVEPGLCFNE